MTSPLWLQSDGSLYRLIQLANSSINPATGVFNSTPVPSAFTASVPNGVTNQVTSIIIQARNSNGIAVNIGGNSVFVAISGSNPISGLAIDNSNGTYTFSYTPTVIGLDTVTITADGIGITGSPYQSHVTSNTAILKQNILNFLTNLPTRSSNKVVVGQFIAEYNHNQAPWTEGSGFGQPLDPINGVNTLTGKFPGAIGIDFVNENGSPNFVGANTPTNLAINYGQAGGLVLVHNLWLNPSTGGPHGDTNINFHDVITPGTTAFVNFQAQMSALADQFQIIQNAGVVVIFRPVPEVNGNWFWWGQGLANHTAADTQAFHQMIWNFFTTTRNLQNIIWVYNVNAQTGNYTANYPGTGFVDIVSFDYYGDNNGSGGTTYNLASNGLATYNALLPFNKIIAMSETGPYVTMLISSPNTFDYQTVINQIRSTLPKITYFMAWDGLDRIDVQNNAVGLMTDPWAIDRSEVLIGATTNPTLVLTQQPGTPFPSGLLDSPNPIIQVTDGAGNNVSTPNVNITVSLSPNTAAVSITPSPLLTDSTGKATVTQFIISGTAGVYNVTFGATGYVGATTQITLTPGLANAAHSTATINNATVGSPNTIIIQAKDTWDNVINFGGSTVVVTVTGANSVSGNAVDQGNGQYFFTYTPSNVGTDTVDIKLDGGEIVGSPFAQTVSAAGSGTYPNKPAGLTPIFEWACTGLWSNTSGVHQTSGFGIITGEFWRFPSGAIADTDATAPQSPPGVFNYIWPLGLSEGVSDGIGFQAWDTAALTERTTYYESIRVKIKESTFQMPNSAVTKLFGFFAVNGAGNANNQAIGRAVDSGVRSVLHIDVGIQNISPPSILSQNLDTNAYLTCGAWHQIEYLFKVNTITGGVANTDGQCDVWIDGHHVIHYTNVLWRTVASPKGFYLRKYDPTWGGNAGGTLNQDQHLLIDHIFAAGA